MQAEQFFSNKRNVRRTKKIAHLLDSQEAVAFFPAGIIVDTPSSQSNLLAFPLSNGQWLQISQDHLTNRERYLLSVFSDDEEVYISHPWYQFLVKGIGPMPQQLSPMQWIHVHHSVSALEEKEELQAWLEVMRSLLPNRVADFQLTAHDIVFVLVQNTFIPIQEVLADTLSAMEFDFGLKLTILVGQMWSHVTDGDWAKLFRAEHELFIAWQQRFQSSRVISFGQVFLWGQGQEISLRPLRNQLAQMISQQDQLADSILVLWEEAAVVTKAAQRLYVHRNTLQYRLEKWLDISGLQLRNLTDLAVCYQVVLEDSNS
ncbi:MULTISPECIES: helix-turn-helix domain-containing protein [unclassified Streptococcus]|uniref:helix-turn-helix domain-containing protein n=1 Tax=unclassified Streptococcus TaxID=2608887 RepID=UPI0010724477|nr:MULTISPECIES: helix-turn-helix domain-containing protein [unclassified Streptococcus]MBF0787240.1 helix-turn-helix domain-containing protein [Streptococcus sp. 19428wC2_LYSM12]MCQ9211926.1 helix-turn-helix domain-containing protein [Streptococcus sp. B01]MCQ9213253.1 helix-turn-helix domain-containing protein [Streptococcus sp. O1]TFV05869.1 PucR family transcriptional regulator [Streptococcus sp. LYSM12]